MGATTTDEVGGPPAGPDIEETVDQEESSSLSFPEGDVDLIAWIQSDEVMALLPPHLAQKLENISSLSNAELALLIGEVLAVLIESGELDMTFEELSVLLLGGGDLSSLGLDLGGTEQNNISLVLVVLSLANELGLLSRSDSRALNQALEILGDPDSTTTEKVQALSFIVSLAEDVLSSELGDDFDMADFPILATVKSEVGSMQNALIAMSAAGSGAQEAHYGFGSVRFFDAYGIELQAHERTYLESSRTTVDQQIFMVECIILALPPDSPDLPVYQEVLSALKSGHATSTTLPDLLAGIDSFSLSESNMQEQFDKHYDTVAGRTYSDWMDMAADSQAKIDARTAFLRLYLPTVMVQDTDAEGKPLFNEDGTPKMRPLTDAEIEERIANDPTVMYYTELRDHALTQADAIANSDYEGDLSMATLPTEMIAYAVQIEFQLAYTFTLDMRDWLTENGGDPGLITRFTEMASFFDKFIQRMMDQLGAI